MKRVALLLTTAALAACATTDPQSGAGIAYHLPRTDASVAADFTLKSCEPIRVDADVKLIPVAGAQTGFYRISGADLASAHVKRDLSVTLSNAGVIQGINSANEDQTPQIIANALKTAAGFLPVLTGAAALRSTNAAPPPALRCRPEMAAAIARHDWLVRKITALRIALADPRHADDRALVRQINRFASEQGALEAGVLHAASFAHEITVEPGNSAGPVSFDFTDLGKWFEWNGMSDEDAQRALYAKFGMDWSTAATAFPTMPQPIPPRARQLSACRFAVAVPAPAAVKLTVVGTGNALPADLRVDKTLAAAQFSPPGSLCLSVGFGESRNVALAFDEFGRTTSFAWSSSARAATISGAVAGSTGDVTSIISSIRGPGQTAKDKAEIERLDAEHRLNELRRCQAVYVAGGDCKKDPADEQ
jgi:hypothetical protein